jgi:signal transduction histidine kinase/CheY-like chemotaxis protein
MRQGRLPRRILALFAVLVLLISLNGLYSIIQGRQRAYQELQQELDGKLILSLSLVRAEQDKFEQLALAIREHATQIASLLEYDRYRALQIVLRQQASLYDIDLMLFTADDAPVISSTAGPNGQPGLARPDVRLEGLQAGLFSLPGALLSPYLKAAETGIGKTATRIGFAVRVPLFYDGGDSAGSILLLRLLDDRPAMVARIAELTGGVVTLLDARRRPLISSDPAALTARADKGTLDLHGHQLFTKRRALYDPQGDLVAYLSVALDSEPISRQQWRLVMTNLVPVVATLVVAALLFLFLKNSVFTRITRFAHSLQRVADGDLQLRIPRRDRLSDERRDEIDIMESYFNLMMEQLQGSARRAGENWQAATQLNRELSDEVRERQRAEQALRVAKQDAEGASRAKALFLANMSHEIRPPMNAILGYAQILRREGGLESSQRHAVETIESSGNHLLGLINDILDLSKIEAGRMELRAVDFDLWNLLDEIEALFRSRCAEKGLQWRLQAKLPARPVGIHGDAGKLRQVLINLLGNAIKFTDHGQVGLMVRAVDDEHYEFEVSDSGPGIDPAAQARIFEAFAQHDEGHSKGGSGLGLAIARSQVALMGGAIALDSRAGEGSRFYFRLRLPPAQAPLPPADLGGPDLVLRSGCRVEALVVDDEPHNREVLCRLLESLGIAVSQAETGHQALARMQQRLPDILFLDYRMPGLDGIQTVDAIHQAFDTAPPIVMLTASVLTQDRERFIAAGCDRFIAKPFRFDVIFSTLAALLPEAFEVPDADRQQTAVETEISEQPTRPAIPAALLNKLREAAEFQLITELQQGLDELAELGPGHAYYARQLQELARAYRMDEITTRLQESR